MALGETIHNVENGLVAALYSAHLQGQARNQARRVAVVEGQSDANAARAVDRLVAALRASRRREEALAEELRETRAALARAQGALIRLSA
ncbi:hypothetical protein ASF36_23430 [Methylobacterium sp. Leaf90]|nr:hypothetical protein ASF36_23430 [Methylobacterium sp. Leaf90]